MSELFQLSWGVGLGLSASGPRILLHHLVSFIGKKAEKVLSLVQLAMGKVKWLPCFPLIAHYHYFNQGNLIKT